MQEEGDRAPAAQVLVNLLLKLGKIDAAIDVAAAHLAGIPESALACPSLGRALPAGRPEPSGWPRSLASKVTSSASPPPGSNHRELETPHAQLTSAFRITCSRVRCSTHGMLYHR